MIIVLWIAFSVGIGFLGQNRSVGFLGAMVLSLVLSPVIGLIITLCSSEEKAIVTKSYNCKHCQLKTSVNSHYCPRCFKDSDGFTVEENKERFSVSKTTSN